MLLSVLSALACPSLTTAGASDEALALLLIKKGILTQEEYEALKKEIEGVVPPAPAMAARQPAAPPVDTESAAPPVDRLRDEVRDELKRRDEGSVKIDAGAQIRVRGDFARNQNFTDFTFTPGASEGQALERIRPRASIELPASKVRLVTQGQWYGRRGGVEEREDLDLYQAYIEWNDILDSPVSIRAGRQELVYGSTFFLGANDFYNGLTWDGLKLTLAPGADFTVDAVGVTMATLNPGDPDIYLAGVYATWRAAEGHALEGYFFYNAGFYPVSHGEVTLPSDGHRWFTLGARVPDALAGSTTSSSRWFSGEASRARTAAEVMTSEPGEGTRSSGTRFRWRGSPASSAPTPGDRATPSRSTARTASSTAPCSTTIPWSET
ncbi:MAG: hypothetical protein A2X53_18660 [Candidatus Rokubacteria bacterium GWA2_70_23]|nr:MAG: hypothetical protein A2X53_18660 [Candidatus Rokubacteria bacterium GWA2_70_23]